MRNIEVTIGDRHFGYTLYKGKVAVNVKFHGWAEPVGDKAQKIWGTLSESQRDDFSQRAWDEVQESWWQDIKDELPDYKIGCDGRQGGYLIFEEIDDGVLLTYEDDGAREPCTACSCASGAPETPYAVAPDEHVSHEAMYGTGTPPLPFPDAPWELHCVHCKEFYGQHVGDRCPMHLGVRYEPHSYVGTNLKYLEDLDSAIAIVEKRAHPEMIQPWLNDILTDMLTEYDYEQSID